MLDAYNWNIGAVELAIVVAVTLIVLVVNWRIMWKCTGHGWLSLLLFVPLLNVLVWLYAAFCKPPQLARASAGSSDHPVA